MKNLKNLNHEKDLPYKVGSWYRIKTEYIIVSTEQPEWGTISVPSTKDVFENSPGWKPRGKIYKIKSGDLIMIAGYVLRNQIVVLGHQDKFLYTDVSELIRINALEHAHNK